MKKLTIYISLILSLTACTISTAKANDFNLLVGGWSKHFNNDYYVSEQYVYKYNDKHNLIGVNYRDFILSTFTNSYYKRSILLGYNYKIVRFNTRRSQHTFSVVGGIVTGYKSWQAGKAYIDKSISFYLMPTMNTLLLKHKGLRLSVDTGFILGKNPVITNSINIKYSF